GPNAGHFVYTSTQNGDGDSNGDGDIDTANEAWGYRNSAARVAEVVRAENGGKAACELLERVAR
ncbi:MAG: hypothetical protein HUU28_12975, partial [Planctomycetaceae bacterium]|nr:hypothetical protein [Planctomycetaceae bacterium]